MCNREQRRARLLAIAVDSRLSWHAPVLEYATRGGGIMNAHTTMTPMKAAQIVEAAGIEDAQTIIVDFTAAGLVKAYALAIQTIDARGASTCVRGATVPADLWQRVILDGIVADVWASDTFRLAG